MQHLLSTPFSFQPGPFKRDSQLTINNASVTRRRNGHRSNSPFFIYAQASGRVHGLPNLARFKRGLIPLFVAASLLPLGALCFGKC